MHRGLVYVLLDAAHLLEINTANVSTSLDWLSSAREKIVAVHTTDGSRSTVDDFDPNVPF